MALNPGDIAFVQYNADGTDNFAFVSLVDIPDGEVVFFTDNGWLGDNPGFGSGEGTITWTAPAGGVTAGTVITIDTTLNATEGSVTEVNDLNFAGSGDQIIAYQGDDPFMAPFTPIAALNNQGNAEFQADADDTNNNDSALPQGLTEGSTAVAIAELDNVIYDGITTGDLATLQAALNNASNWTGSDTTNQTFAGTFSVETGNVVVDNFIDEADGSLDDDVSLRDAIALIPDGGTITFANSGTIDLTLGELAIDKSLTIDGESNSITIDAGGNSRVFLIDDGNSTADQSVTISGLTITGGFASGSNPDNNRGGGIYNREILNLSNSTVTGNSATNGGGIAIGIGTATIINSTIADNTASGGQVLGGGIGVASGTVNVSNSTVSGNSAFAGGGIGNASGQVNISSSLISGNSANVGDEVRTGSGTVTADANNLFGDVSKTNGEAFSVASGSFAPGASDITATSDGTTPTALSGILETTLADNGATTTQTLALVAGSPALNAGSNPDGLSFDQRGEGFPREVNGQADIGAFENSAPTATNDRPLPGSEFVVPGIFGITANSTDNLIEVLANDSDPDGDSLTITAVTAPDNGGTVAIVNGETAIEYTPVAGFFGQDRFEYTISDGKGGTDTATVVVGVVNDGAPTATNDRPLPGSEFVVPGIFGITINSMANLIEVLANDSDPNGDPLTIIGVTQPVNGSTSIVGNAIEYTPATDFVGQDEFEYTISDGNGGTDTATVVVGVVNDGAPTATNDRPLPGSEFVVPGIFGITINSTDNLIEVLANDSDPNGDPLTITAVTAPVNGGTAVVNGNAIEYTPAANFAGQDRFEYTISDGNGGTDTATVVVGVVDDPLVVDGTNGDDELEGGPGDNTINGLGGDDELFGDAGNDTINGGEGNDLIKGQAGDDILNGGLDDDQIFGDAGNDTLNGDEGNDELRGNDGNDILNGGDGNDRLGGVEGDDMLNGGDGNDRLDGGAGNDTLNGDAGDDRLQGREGNDTLDGGAGNDTLIGVRDGAAFPGDGESDMLTGGTEADLFVLGTATTAFYLGNGTSDFADILDFEDGTDAIQIFGAFADYTLGDDNGNATLSLGGDRVANLLGVSSAVLTGADFTTAV